MSDTADLLDEKLSEKDLESKVENVGDTPAPDGMLEAPDGSVYLTDIEGGAIDGFCRSLVLKETGPQVSNRKKRLLLHFSLPTNRDPPRHVSRRP